MTHQQLREHHFKRLNSYRNSAEYAESIGADVPPGDQQSLIGDRWEIDRAIYEEFRDMLPPLGQKGGSFFMREFSFDDVTTKFTREGDKFYCEFTRLPVAIRGPDARRNPVGAGAVVRRARPRYRPARHGVPRRLLRLAPPASPPCRSRCGTSSRGPGRTGMRRTVIGLSSRWRSRSSSRRTRASRRCARSMATGRNSTRS